MMKFSVSLCAIVVVASATTEWAGGGPGIETGKRLFNDPRLGESRNDRSCASCHLNGANLAHAGQIRDLAGQINRCIVGPLEGKPLDRKSAAMQSLVMYVESVSKDVK